MKTPRERRRLQLINGLLLIAEEFGHGGYLHSEYRRVRAHLSFGGTPVECHFEYRDSSTPDVLSVKLHGNDVTRGAEFTDRNGSRIEDQLADIVVEAARIGVDVRRWLDRSNAEFRERLAREAIEQKRQASIETEAAAKREREQGVRQRQIKLLRAAKNLARANDIRAMVVSVKSFASEQGTAGEQWIEWALAQADAIDPTKNGNLEASILDHLRSLDGAGE